MALQNVTLVGNLGADPESRASNDGTTFVTLRIACSNTGKDKGTSWYRCTLMGRMGEIALEFLHKGNQVCVVGDQSIREFEGKDGETRTSVEVFVKTLTLLNNRDTDADEAPRQSRGAQGQQNQRQQNARPAASRGRAATAVADDDDIPF